MKEILSVPVEPDADAFLANLRREGTPRRVHYIELFLDAEVQEEICRRFGLTRKLDETDPFFAERRQIAIQRFLGYDYVTASLELSMPLVEHEVGDTAALPRDQGRAFVDEHRGPITSWEDFHRYPWPDPATASARSLEFYEENLPQDMCVISDISAHFCEYLTWLMGYETLCYALHDQRDLVGAISEKILQLVTAVMQRLRRFKRIKAVWGSDDMGFKTSTLISPKDLREFVLPGHRRAAAMAHEAGWLYLLHSCGNLREIMPDLIDDVGIDAKHSFEDAILPPTQAKALYGQRISILGGIDVDFLCRADEPALRRRVRETLDACMPGGGYCLGSGNSVANYVPVDNYLAMLDEGRRYAG